MKIVKNKKLHYYGIIGIIGSFISVLADYFLSYNPQGISGFESIYSVSIDKVYTVFAQTSHTRLIYSNYLSIIGIPLGIFGLLHVYHAIKKGGKLLAKLGVVIGLVGYTAGTVFHASLSYTATVYRIKTYVNEDTNEILVGLLALFRDFSQPLAYIFLAAIFMFSIIYIYLCVLGKTDYPRWMCLVNPLTIQVIFIIISLFTSPEVRTFLYVSVYNSSLLLFYTVSVIVLFRKEGN
jgi:hypothetical protein